MAYTLVITELGSGVLIVSILGVAVWLFLFPYYSTNLQTASFRRLYYSFLFFFILGEYFQLLEAQRQCCTANQIRNRLFRRASAERCSWWVVMDQLEVIARLGVISWTYRFTGLSVSTLTSSATDHVLSPGMSQNHLIWSFRSSLTCNRLDGRPCADFCRTWYLSKTLILFCSWVFKILNG